MTQNLHFSKIFITFAEISPFMTDIKTLYIIAGPNGAGKTTASYTVLPEILQCNNFVNIDEIAKGISPFAPDKVGLQAGKLMLRRINELLEQNETFAIETTLATRTYTKLIERARNAGYKVFLMFLYLDSAIHAINRVSQRVSEGGHDVPDEIIKRRYKSGLYNLINLYMPVCDNVAVYNNTYSPTVLIAKKNGKFQIENQEMWNNIIRQL